MLFLAEELKAAFGGDLKYHMRSPKLLREQAEHTNKSIRLKVGTLPLSRSKEANPFRSGLPPDGRMRRFFRRDHRLDSMSHIDMAMNRERPTELEMVEQTSAASSALSLHSEAVDTNGPGSEHGP